MRDNQAQKSKKALNPWMRSFLDAVAAEDGVIALG
jgi:hypothetical protein